MVGCGGKGGENSSLYMVFGAIERSMDDETLKRVERKGTKLLDAELAY